MGCLVVLVETVPGPLCVSPMAAGSSFSNLHFLEDLALLSETCTVSKTSKLGPDLTYLRQKNERCPRKVQGWRKQTTVRLLEKRTVVLEPSQSVQGGSPRCQNLPTSRECCQYMNGYNSSVHGSIPTNDRSDGAQDPRDQRPTAMNRKKKLQRTQPIQAHFMVFTC